MNDNQIYTDFVRAGKRTYFLDVKETSNGSRYLRITESKNIGDEEFEKQRIYIFEEDIEKMASSFNRVLLNFHRDKSKNSNSLSQKSHMEELKEKYSNAYKPWTKTDDMMLQELFQRKHSMQSMINYFQRNEGAIISRLKKLGLT